jgi:hypothetical protein
MRAEPHSSELEAPVTLKDYRFTDFSLSRNYLLYAHLSLAVVGGEKIDHFTEVEEVVCRSALRRLSAHGYLDHAA